MNPTDLTQFVGRKGVYIENGLLCLVKITSVGTDERRMMASLQAASDLLFRIEKCEFSIEPSPFGESWSVSQEWKFFFVDDEYWDASLQSGFRLILSQGAVDQFLARDVSWLDEYF